MLIIINFIIDRLDLIYFTMVVIVIINVVATIIINLI